MQGVTTAIVAFIFVCILFPRLVKHRAQFYAAFAIIILMMFIESLSHIIRSGGFYAFVAAFNGLLQLAALILIVLATGGLSLKDLTGEFRNAFEVIRRGETEKEVIIPRSGETPQAEKAPAPAGKAPMDSSSLPVE